MYRHVLVPLDGSKAAEAVLKDLSEMASSGCLERITLLTVAGFPAPLDPASAMLAYDAAEAQQSVSAEYLRDIQGRLSSLPVTVDSKVIEAPDAAQTIVDFADDQQVDLIMIASRGHSGLTRVILGSVAERVLKAAPCPVLFIRVPS